MNSVNKLEFDGEICAASLASPSGRGAPVANRGGEGVFPSQSKIKDFCQLPQKGEPRALLRRSDKFQFASSSDITRTPCGLVMGSLFVVHKYFIMVTIENKGRMCYNKMDYIPGGIYVEYY